MKTYLAIGSLYWGKGKTPSLAKAMLAKACGPDEYKRIKTKSKIQVFESDDPQIHVGETGNIRYRSKFPAPIQIEPTISS